MLEAGSTSRNSITSELLTSESLHTLDSQIHRFSGKLFTTLPFPCDFEALFEEKTASYRANRMWREGLATIVLSCFCLLMDLVALDDPHWSQIVRHILMTIPLALLANEIVRRGPPMWIREGVVTLAISTIASINLLLQASAGMAGVFFGMITNLICALFVSSAMRLRFRYQITTISCLGAGVYILLATTHYLPPSVRSMAMSVFTLAMGLVLLSAYSLEREERLAFLLRLRGDTRERVVTLSNAALLEAVQSDSLTGLGNRFKLDERMSLLWESEATQGSCVSVIVLDVDRFKLINDTYGHTYGDQVLIRIASLIESALHNGEDLAVRWGGEEFIVLLPKTDLKGAVIVAERIRSLVEMAGSPPPSTKRAQGYKFLTTTISCGVCSCTPSESSRKTLIASADAALYEAKQKGRNRVESSASAPEFTDVKPGLASIAPVLHEETGHTEGETHLEEWNNWVNGACHLEVDDRLKNQLEAVD